MKYGVVVRTRDAKEMLHLLTLTQEAGYEFESWGNSFKVRDFEEGVFPEVPEGGKYPRITGDEYVDLLLPVDDEDKPTEDVVDHREVNIELGLTVRPLDG